MIDERWEFSLVESMGVFRLVLAQVFFRIWIKFYKKKRTLKINIISSYYIMAHDGELAYKM